MKDHDFIFQRVIDRRGFYLMEPESLIEYQTKDRHFGVKMLRQHIEAIKQPNGKYRMQYAKEGAA